MAKNGLKTLFIGILIGAGMMHVLPQKSRDFLQISSPLSLSSPHVKTVMSDLEKEVHQQVNQHRKNKNLPPLNLHPQISDQARIHSQNMAQGKVIFSHNGFKERVQAIKLPYRSVAENVAYNMGFTDPVSHAVIGWIESPGHRQNMEGEFNLTGIGIAKNAQGEYYFTQIFMRK